MFKKVQTIQEGLDTIETIDQKIKTLLDKEDYGSIIEILKDRLAVISQMNILKEQKGLSAQDTKRINEVFDGANNIQKQVQEKKNKISERLNKRRTIVSQTRKIRY